MYFSRSRNASNTYAHRVSGIGQTTGNDLLGDGLMFGQLALDQRYGLTQYGNVSFPYFLYVFGSRVFPTPVSQFLHQIWVDRRRLRDTLVDRQSGIFTAVFDVFHGVRIRGSTLWKHQTIPKQFVSEVLPPGNFG